MKDLTMDETQSSVSSVVPAPPIHPSLSTRQVQAAHALAELPIGMTWTEKANRLGVTRETLWGYRQIPEFIQEVIKVSRANMRAEIPGAHQVLLEGLKRGGAAGAKYLELFLKMTGELQDTEQANALKTWLDAVGECASDLLIIALQRRSGMAPLATGPGAGRGVASRVLGLLEPPYGAQGDTPLEPSALERELDL